MSAPAFIARALGDARPPDGMKLAGALLTTFQPPEPGFLIEDLFPQLLGLNATTSDTEGLNRPRIVELEQRLDEIRDHLLVVSSSWATANSGDREVSPYSWFWRCVRVATVGRSGPAVQHAKLWLLHWLPADPNRRTRRSKAGGYLELIISSANLTRDTFRNQVQAGWRILLPVSDRTHAKSWGVLPALLEQLGLAAGEDERLDRFRRLLIRTKCPAGVEFIASAPGKHDRPSLSKKPWGIAGLYKLRPKGSQSVLLDCAVPFVGDWTEQGLADWRQALGAGSENLQITCLAKGSNRPERQHWRLTGQTKRVLEASGVEWRALSEPTDDSAVADTIPAGDTRWWHAKLYAARRGRTRRLLITSANFSPSAWGVWKNGRLVIRNFELGVVINGAGLPLRHRGTVASPHLNNDPSDAETRNTFLWARAEWDGACISVEVIGPQTRAPRATVRYAGGAKAMASSWRQITATKLWKCDLPWSAERTGPPLACRIRTEAAEFEVPVLDSREGEDRDYRLGNDPDDAEVTALRDQLLFEDYGGRMAERDDPREWTNPQSHDSHEKEKASYDVPAIVAARRHLGVVDEWRRRLDDASDSQLREWIHRDGTSLRLAFVRQASRELCAGDPSVGVGARVAAEELAKILEEVLR